VGNLTLNALVRAVEAAELSYAVELLRWPFSNSVLGAAVAFGRVASLEAAVADQDFVHQLLFHVYSLNGPPITPTSSYTRGKYVSRVASSDSHYTWSSPCDSQRRAERRCPWWCRRTSSYKLSVESVRHLLAFVAETEGPVLDHVSGDCRQLRLTHDAFQARVVVEELLHRHVLLQQTTLIHNSESPQLWPQTSRWRAFPHALQFWSATWRAMSLTSK